MMSSGLCHHVLRDSAWQHNVTSSGMWSGAQSDDPKVDFLRDICWPIAVFSHMCCISLTFHVGICWASVSHLDAILLVVLVVDGHVG